MATFRFKGGVALILFLLAALAAFSLVAVGHLLMGQFNAWLVFPVGVPVAIIAGYYTWNMVSNADIETESTEAKIFDFIVIIGICFWTLFNLIFTSQHLFTNRDPATYNLAADWLGTHQTLLIEKPSAEKQLRVDGITAESLGFASDPKNDQLLQAQGAHLLPSLQALVHRVSKLSILRVNVLFGATALLALYAFARLVVKPRWAALTVLTMSLSLPLIFVTRDSYSEPLTMTFIFAGLALLIIAQQFRQEWQWWLAGVVIGASALARIDAYLMFISIELAVIIWLMVARRSDRTALVKCAIWLFLGMAIGGYVAWLDVYTLSSNYYYAHQKFILPEIKLIGLLAFAGIAVIILNWRYKFVDSLDKLTKGWRDKAIWLAVGGFFLVLASRPLWNTGYQTNDAGVVSRTFSEQTINWIVWYFGPVTFVAGVVGFILVAIRMMRGKDKHLLPFVLAFMTVASLYLLKPTITGDQVWATRRLLPVVFPAIILFAMWSFQHLFQAGSGKWRGYNLNFEIISTVLVTVAVLSPIVVTYPFSLRSEHASELAQLQAVCRKTQADSVVVWAGNARQFAVQPTRAVCGNDSLGLEIKTDLGGNKALLAQLAHKASENNRPVIVGFYKEDAKLLPLGGQKADMLVSSIQYNEVEHTYKRAPRNMLTIERAIFMGGLNQDGTITPLSAT